MWKSDKWVMVGIIGGFVSLALLLVFAFAFDEGEGYAVLSIMCLLLVFFGGYTLGGFKSGIKWVFYSIGLVLCAFAVGFIIGFMRGEGDISPFLGLALVVILYIIITFLLRKFNQWKAEKNNDKDILMDCDSDEDYDEGEIEEYPIGQDFIFLIQPEWYKPDKVYKLLSREGKLYFCRVGGQFYEIDEIEETYGMNSSEDELLKDSYNYKIEIANIAGILLRKKKSAWTGHLLNNGTLKMSITGGKTRKFIVHPINEIGEVKSFFEGRGINVEER